MIFLYSENNNDSNSNVKSTGSKLLEHPCDWKRFPVFWRNFHPLNGGFQKVLSLDSWIFRNLRDKEHPKEFRLWNGTLMAAQLSAHPSDLTKCDWDWCISGNFSLRLMKFPCFEEKRANRNEKFSLIDGKIHYWWFI